MTIGIGRKERLAQVVGNIILAIGVFITLTPFLYMVSASFKPGSELFSIPVRPFPDSLYWGNYKILFEETSFVRWFANSVFVALARTAIAIVLSLMAGYAFAKFEFAGKRVLFILVLGTLTLPLYVILVPLFTMMTRFNWVNTYWALILPFTAQAIGIFLARQQLLGVPDELLEAARIDGAGEWAIFTRIIVPLAQPIIAVMGILFFTASWNDFLWPLIMITSEEKFTVSLGLPTLLGPYEQDYGAVMAGSFMGTLPIIIIFLIFQRRFIEGIMAGALKG